MGTKQKNKKQKKNPTRKTLLAKSGINFKETSTKARLPSSLPLNFWTEKNSANPKKQLQELLDKLFEDGKVFLSNGKGLFSNFTIKIMQGEYSLSLENEKKMEASKKKSMKKSKKESKKKLPKKKSKSRKQESSEDDDEEDQEDDEMMEASKKKSKKKSMKESKKKLPKKKSKKESSEDDEQDQDGSTQKWEDKRKKLVLSF